MGINFFILIFFLLIVKKKGITYTAIRAIYVRSNGVFRNAMLI